MKRLVYFSVLMVLTVGIFAAAAAQVPEKGAPVVGRATDTGNGAFVAAVAALDTANAKLLAPE